MTATQFCPLRKLSCQSDMISTSLSNCLLTIMLETILHSFHLLPKLLRTLGNVRIVLLNMEIQFLKILLEVFGTNRWRVIVVSAKKLLFLSILEIVSNAEVFTPSLLKILPSIIN